MASVSGEGGASQEDTTAEPGNREVNFVGTETLCGHQGAISSIQFSPDGKLLASACLCVCVCVCMYVCVCVSLLRTRTMVAVCVLSLSMFVFICASTIICGWPWVMYVHGQHVYT